MDETRMRELMICGICLEPITNFVCIDCLMLQIKESLPKSFGSILDELHINLSKEFENDENVEFCIRCKRFKEIAICPYCYIKEIFDKISENDENEAMKIVKIFDFDFHAVGYGKSIKMENWEPPILDEREKEYDLNICEICGQPAELVEKNSMLVCESCKDEN